MDKDFFNELFKYNYLDPKNREFCLAEIEKHLKENYIVKSVLKADIEKLINVLAFNEGEGYEISLSAIELLKKGLDIE